MCFQLEESHQTMFGFCSSQRGRLRGRMILSRRHSSGSGHELVYLLRVTSLKKQTCFFT